MKIDWIESQDNIDWDKLCDFYNSIPLGDKSPADLELVFSNSMFKCFALAENEIVGAGRVLADGQNTAYLCDIGVSPKCQGMGMGKQIVDNLIKQAKGHKKIILYACPGKEGFYAKLGFKKMNTAMAIFEDEAQMIADGIIS